MLEAERLPLPTKTGAKEILVVKLLIGIVCLALPVLDIHRITMGTNTIHAVATQPALLVYEQLPQVFLIIIVAIIAVFVSYGALLDSAVRLPS